MKKNIHSIREKKTKKPLEIKFSRVNLKKRGALALCVFEGRTLTGTAAAVDRKTDGMLTRAIKTSRFKGEKNQTLELLAPAHVSATRILLFGLGRLKDITRTTLQAVGGTFTAKLMFSGERNASMVIDTIEETDLDSASMASNVGFGAKLRSYRFDRYETKTPPDKKPTLEKLTLMLEKPKPAQERYAALEKVAQGVFFTRDMVNEPANILYPEKMVDRARCLEELGVEVEALGAEKMKKLGMGALLGVGKGSAQEPKLLVMQWKGASASIKPVAFVGKGITFDSGGISLKSGSDVWRMKGDMAGAAAVIGAMKALAGRKAKANIVGVAALSENMPSGTAQRPGDIVTSMSGLTIEVLNTDAEGRLVLADALWYTQDRFQPQCMVDLATLTGAKVTALGFEYAGMFSNDDSLASKLMDAGLVEDEKLWRMPLDKAYDKDIESDIADMKNMGAGRAAGAIAAAVFLQRFVNDVPWAHVDMAGNEIVDTARPTVPKGAWGFGVRLLSRLIADNFEQK
ncbi:MAG: leucyl aminopeptidase [Desulfatiglandaceae bacterium]|jgi:leucyl aminopeptidase